MTSCSATTGPSQVLKVFHSTALVEQVEVGRHLPENEVVGYCCLLACGMESFVYFFTSLNVRLDDISSRSTASSVLSHVASPDRLSLVAPGKAKSWRLPRSPMRRLPAPQGNETPPINCANNAPLKESIDSCCV